MTERELELIKQAVLILCRNIRPDGNMGYLGGNDRYTMLEIYQELTKGGKEE